MENELFRFRQQIAEHFTLEELKVLAFDLQINWDELQGETLSTQNYFTSYPASSPKPFSRAHPIFKFGASANRLARFSTPSPSSIKASGI